jgi:hypothetical protein
MGVNPDLTRTAVEAALTKDMQSLGGRCAHAANLWPESRQYHAQIHTLLSVKQLGMAPPLPGVRH